MSVTIQNTEVIVKKIKRLFSSAKLDKLIYETAADLRNMIHERSMKGRGLKGGFKSYSTTPYYRPKNMRPAAKGGRRRNIRTGQPMKTVFYEGGYRQFAALTKGNTLPNLSASGAMFRDMQAQAAEKLSALVGFSKEAEAQKAFFNNELRPFFGATKKEESKILQAANKRFNRLVTAEGL